MDLVSRFIFPTPPSSYDENSFPNEIVWIPKRLELGARCPPEQCVPCLFLFQASARFLILYLHSNAEDVGKCHQFCAVMREQFQAHVLAIEYPGYGLCPAPGGPATSDSVTENAFVVFRFVREVLKWPMDSILIMGRSIGTGPAVSLAVQYKVSGLILVAPFLSIKDLLRDSLGSMISNFVQERFPNKDRMHLIRSPVLVVHGQKDATVPVRHGVELFELVNTRKLLVSPESMEHNTNLLSDVSYFVLPMLQFFSLPDYCFEDLAMPAWAFQCRLNMLDVKKDARVDPRLLTRSINGEQHAKDAAKKPTAEKSSSLQIPQDFTQTGVLRSRGIPLEEMPKSERSVVIDLRNEDVDIAKEPPPGRVQRRTCGL
eukprot:gnl/TRDRNA2_/TRDRNA2_190648_c0_seq1.p1 gnl/TRDRNA2_/TRDRNA2_190648_c0~~gnl/TRDRNA2_/TRDRNA2_190648_c0_seq1.p1  ORF type:complete len:372 (-),score=53.23 gnl/TRDRNA2_/TRDRNA2_190648_c0_seq1:134-1249(-)